MKPLIKYPATLFILLLIGYSQLFAPLYRGSAVYSPIRKNIDSDYGQAIATKTTDFQAVFFAEEEEEEDERVSLKKYSEDSPVYTSANLCNELLQHIKCCSSVYQHFSCLSFFKSPYLLYRVFRL